MAIDRIPISDLRARCIIGVNGEERREKQDVVINLIIFADLLKAGKSERFEDTVDYRAIKRQILTMVEASKFHLIEALTEAAAQIRLKNLRVSEVQARVEKPSALRFARSVGVEIRRRQENINASPKENEIGH
jgi:D-erythro-7,8-dihydroneopterin triphosphate epimerase